MAVALGAVALVRSRRPGTGGRGRAIAGLVRGSAAVLVTLLWVLAHVGLIALAIFSGGAGVGAGPGPSA